MQTYPLFLDLEAGQSAQGTVPLPGSKSISNRILLLAALAKNPTHITGLLDSDDTRAMLTALKTLGVLYEHSPTLQTCLVHGINSHFPVQKASLFLGNAGTAFRPLTAALAVLGGDYVLKGVPRMHERPIADLVDTLLAAGAQISYAGNSGYPPLHIQTGDINASHLSIRGNVSSQFLTALLMATPLMAKTQLLTIEVTGELISKPYVTMTLNLMRRFGVKIACQNWQIFTIEPGQQYVSPGTMAIEADASSASYFLAAGAISGGPVKVLGVGQNSIQGDIRFAHALEQMGSEITMGDNWIQACAHRPLQAIDADLNHIPDAAMTLAVVALYAEGTSILRNIGSWRVKETDRLSAMTTELRKLGAMVEEGADYLRITPPRAKIKAATIDTYEDHRIAMGFSLVCLDGMTRKGACIRINNPGCVSKTFPDYFEVLKTVFHSRIF